MTGERRPGDLFEGHPEGLALFEAVAAAVAAIGEVEIRTGKSQIAFRRRRPFAFVWRPGQYLDSTVPAVLSIALPERLDSDRFKEVVHPSSNVWMHHLELLGPEPIDAEVRAWLETAYRAAD
ncbi:DUF5655 domain-containing protein [Glycomyces sp. YM15]|uniref:DUF5655 domain-containing protein n=1 Tax=Glycomyces sp. YM15 TaxID=2800446 RepID=UPI0019634252|nr:DUF5655 domain-containing protein [Glycomyces sp. YM15]